MTRRVSWLLQALASFPLLAGGGTLGAAPLTADARALLNWVQRVQDNGAEPFIVIDKRAARLWLFNAHRQPLGDVPVLVGSARGDWSVPGIGERPLAQVRPHERTTPAGRFIAEVGRNANGEDVFWIDYEAAVSMHRVRTTNPSERRLQRLATPTENDNRISYGCVNVPANFYDQMIRPQFKGHSPVVYVLPETMPLSAIFVPPRAPT